ncbi:MAG TPA: hypothetical protein VFW20_05190 [Candidatus Limnocylindrales bacterium]|nr:hypothetical protein [Candidatus Limnocylindrales bacterium]
MAAALAFALPLSVTLAATRPEPPAQRALSAKSTIGVDVDSPVFAVTKSELEMFGADAEQIALVAAGAINDPTGDQFTVASLTSSFQSKASDIRLAAFFELKGSPAARAEWFGPNGVLAQGTPDVVATARRAPTTSADLYGSCIEFDQIPVRTGGARVEAGLAGLGFSPVNPSIHPTLYQPPRGQPYDVLNGMNLAWATRSDNGGPWGLHLLIYDAQQRTWVEGTTGAISVLNTDTLCTFIPEAEADAFGPRRTFADIMIAAGGQTQMAVDSYPDIQLPPMVPNPPAPVLTIDAGSTTTTTPAASAQATGSASGAATTSSGPGSSGAGTTPTGPTGPTSSAGVSMVVIAIIGIILIAVIALGWLVVGRGRKPGSTSTASVIGGSAVANDPCEALLEAMASARAACDDASQAAQAAADAKTAADARVVDAQQELDKAQSEQRAAQGELDKALAPPDQGAELGSTSFDGKDIHVSQLDESLLQGARAAANAAHAAAVGAATSDAERQAAQDQWVEELRRIDGPDGLDYVRANANALRDWLIQAARDRLSAAEDALAAAQQALEEARAGAKQAADAATSARQRADEACARAAAAEKAAIDAGCYTPPAPPKPAAQPEPPTPQPPAPPTPPTPPGSGPRASCPC